MHITLLLFLMLVFFIILGSFYAYKTAFQAPTPGAELNELPSGEAYKPHMETIRQCVADMKALPCTECSVLSHDGLKLFGRLYQGQKSAPVHLMFHGYKSNAFLDSCGGGKLALSLGHNVILTDQRAHGKSQGRTISFGIKERFDVLTWLEFIKETFGADTPVFLWGLSMGASTVLMSTSLGLSENVVGILADCPFSSPKEIIQKVCRDLHFPAKLVYPFVWLGALLFGGFALEECTVITALKQNRVPILLFHGQADGFVPCEMSKKIKEACPDLITLEVVPEADHGLCYMVAPERYQKAVLSFIQKQWKK